MTSTVELQDTLARMVELLWHRGPDAAGMYLDHRCGLGMRRLAIVDIAAGQQPYYSRDKTVVAVFNGEIYNYQPLRRKLADRGVVFSSGSDGEVIIPLYLEHGLEFVHHLLGMFAIALWDSQAQRLVCARDRVGKKPLYYHITADGTIYFASEMKAIFGGLGKVFPLDPAGIDQYFTFGYPLTPRTLFQKVYELPPATLGVYENNQWQERRYWHPTFIPEAQKNDPGQEQAQEELAGLLRTAVADRLMGEAPLGCYLSGGVDSSVIAALIGQVSPAPLTLFTLAFPGQTFDDGEFADLAAAHLHAPYQKFIADASLADLYPQALWHTERPMRFSVPLLFSLLAQKVHAAGIKVILSGEGADELWAGYECFRGAVADQAGKPLYSWHPDAAEFSGQTIPGHGTVFKKILGFEPGRAAEWLLLERFKEEFYSFGLKRSLQRQKAWQGLTDLVDISRCASLHPLDRELYLEMMTRLPCEILFTGDRMSMAHAVEVRMPFLDTAIIQFTTALPVFYKLNAGSDKYLLRKTFEKTLPNRLVYRPKKPFYGPMKEWLLGDQSPEWAKVALLPKEIERQGLFNPAVVVNYQAALMSGKLPPYLAFAYEAALMGILGLQMLPKIMAKAVETKRNSVAPPGNLW